MCTCSTSTTPASSCARSTASARALAAQQTPPPANPNTIPQDTNAPRNRNAPEVPPFESVPARDLDGSEEREIVLNLGGQELRFPGQVYLFQFVTPTFYFPVTTAYAILRHNGVAIGKRDYLGG
ncbi:DUF1993 family protein [Lacticaseibacillus rhamnosus]